MPKQVAHRPSCQGCPGHKGQEEVLPSLPPCSESVLEMNSLKVKVTHLKGIEKARKVCEQGRMLGRSQQCAELTSMGTQRGGAGLGSEESAC